MIADLFAEALKAHLAGDLAEAERLYGRVIEADPRHASAHANLATDPARQQTLVALLFDLLRQLAGHRCRGCVAPGRILENKRLIKLDLARQR